MNRPQLTRAACLIGALALAEAATGTTADDFTHVVRTVGPQGQRTAWIRSGDHSLALAVPGGGVPLLGTCELVNGGFHNGLYAWDSAVSAGGPPDGSVTIVGGRARIAEGASFLTTISQTLCVPDGALELSFDLATLAFDTTASFVPDAFEVSLLDPSVQPVVPGWSSFATSFLNVQEDGTTSHGPGVQVQGSFVTLDLTGVAAGTDVTLYFDLIGADADQQGFVEIDDVLLDAGEIGFEFCNGVDCPCGNEFPSGGCANSSGLGAILSATGSPSVMADDLVLTIENVGPSYALVVVGQQAVCTQLGDGFLSTGPGPFQQGLLRFLAAQPGPGGSIELGPGIIDFAETSLGATGLLVAGSTWMFTAVYRDGPVSPCGSQFNLSNGLAVTFTN